MQVVVKRSCLKMAAVSCGCCRPESLNVVPFFIIHAPHSLQSRSQVVLIFRSCTQIQTYEDAFLGQQV